MNIKNKLSLLLAIILFLLVLTFVLYKKNIIFVKYIEQGYVYNKIEYTDYFLYKIYIDETLHEFISYDKSIDLSFNVINFKYRKNKILKVYNIINPLCEKIMSKSNSYIELEYSKNIGYAKNLNIYKINDDNIEVEALSSLIVGASNIKIYKDSNNNIKTIIIDKDIPLSTIRVGLKTDDFSSFHHDQISFVSASPLEIIDKIDNISINILPQTEFTLNNVNNSIEMIYNNKKLIFNNRIYINALYKNEEIKILSYKRSYGNPAYIGSFEVSAFDNSLKLINEIYIENYLKKVIPSEMPSSFGIEALKAQAIAARTYAISDLLSDRYSELGFHVDDSTMCQVYNNMVENKLCSLAVDSTQGLVMKYEGQFIDAKYYSTSHGYGANANEIWSINGKFPGDDIPYLKAKSYLLDNSKYALSDEETAKKFFKDWALKSYDSISPFFRWKVYFTGEEIKNTLEKNLPIVYNSQSDYILTLKDDSYISMPIEQNCIGSLKDIKVTKRGSGGNIMELVITGANGSYKIIKELNIRYVLRPRSSDTQCNRDIVIERLNSSPIKNQSLLPSAFMVFDINKDSNDYIKDIYIYGGGYGHSTGMSQYGASYLASKGYKYDEILKIYYDGIYIEKLY